MAVERDDLPVEDDGFGEPLRPFFERARDFRELSGLVVAEARPERDLFASRGNLDNGAYAVVFRFVNEAGIVQRRADERREHRARDGGCRHPPIMTDARPQLFFRLDPVAEVVSRRGAALEIPMVGAYANLVFRRLAVGPSSHVRLWHRICLDGVDAGPRGGAYRSLCHMVPSSRHVRALAALSSSVATCKIRVNRSSIDR